MKSLTTQSVRWGNSFQPPLDKFKQTKVQGKWKKSTTQDDDEDTVDGDWKGNQETRSETNSQRTRYSREYIEDAILRKLSTKQDKSRRR